MSFKRCIDEALKKKRITGKKAEEAKKKYEGFFEGFRRSGMSEEAADEAAAREATVEFDQQRRTKAIRDMRTIEVRQQILNDLQNYRLAKGLGGKGKFAPAEAALAKLEADDVSQFADFVTLHRALLGEHMGIVESLLEASRPRGAGTIRPVGHLPDLVRALYDDPKAGEAAREMAAALKKLDDHLVDRLNRMGAGIRKLEDYRAPQRLSSRQVDNVDVDEFIRDMQAALDWEKMRRPESGMPILPEERTDLLTEIYNTIRTEGDVKLEPGAVRVNSTTSRFQHHRFLKYKDADAWLKINEKYGAGNVFEQLIAHIDDRTRTLAMMEIFGPNATATKEFIKQTVLKMAADATKRGERISPRFGKGRSKTPSDVARRRMARFDELYNSINNISPVLTGLDIGNITAGFRNILTSASLGSTIFIAFPSDLFTTALTKRFNRLPGTADFRKYLRLMNPKNAKDRRIAVASGLNLESALNMANAHQRLLGEITGPEVTKRISDFVLRISLLTPHTQAARHAFGLDVMTAFANFADRKFDDLPFKGVLERYGITAKEWNLFRATDPFTDEGFLLLRPIDMRFRSDLDRAVADRIADKFKRLIQRETEFAVPTVSERARSKFASDTQPNTFIGEIIRSTLMWKSFAATIAFTHMRRPLMQAAGAGQFAYYAAFVTGMSLAGALSTQLRQIRDGKDPINMNPDTEAGRQFWFRAIVAGGGLGIIGDLVLGDVEDFDRSFKDFFAGPVIERIGQLGDLTFGNLVQLLTGEDTDFIREFRRTLPRVTPGSTIFYLKPLLERGILDSLERQLDPKAEQRFRRIISGTKSRTGQDFFLPPGRGLVPERTPDLSKAVESEEDKF